MRSREVRRSFTLANFARALTLNSLMKQTRLWISPSRCYSAHRSIWSRAAAAPASCALDMKFWSMLSRWCFFGWFAP